MAEQDNPIINDILCYISSARDTISRDKIIINAFSYYTADDIKTAKTLICTTTGERNVKRKECASEPNVPRADIRDICTIFEKIESEGKNIPKFVAGGFMSFPPNGFEYLAPMVCSLREEIAAMKQEITNLRAANEADVRALNNVNVIAQDVCEIKALLTRGGQNLSSRESNRVSEPSASEAVAAPGSAAQNSVNNNNDELPENNDDFVEVSNRPYANALRRNGLPSNPARRQVPPPSRIGHHARISQNSMQNGEPRNGQGRGRNTQPSGGQRNGQPRRDVIAGRRGSNCAFAGSERVLDIYVGGCVVSSTAEQITEHCAANGVNAKKCELLQSTSEWSKSYKISVAAEDREKLLDPELWPRGVFVRKFYRNRRRND